MIQLTDKLFAVAVEEDANNFGINAYSTWIDWKSKGKRHYHHVQDLRTYKEEKVKLRLLGTVSKDTIDFDVEPFIEHWNIPNVGEVFMCYTGKVEFYLNRKQSFRSLLTSKGCNPDEKHLIIEKI